MKVTILHEVVNGLLHIGDPHISSRRPGTRNDVGFTSVVIDKLRQAAVIANKRKLIPIILGDLFDREDDTDAEMMTLLIRVLNEFDIKPFVLSGNHDLSETVLTDDTALAVLREADVVNVIDESGYFLLARLHDGDSFKTVAVGGSPHSSAVPSLITEVDCNGLNGARPDVFGWITHEDMAFDGAYPGSKPLVEIDGCSWVVNGHMHLTKPPVTVGNTVWHNPGNITRQSKDCARHVPSVWEMNAAGRMKQIPLVYVEDVFDAVKGYVNPDHMGAEINITSTFVEMLVKARDDAGGGIKTQDGSVLKEDIAAVCYEKNVSIGAINILNALHEMALG
jgi:hypothetical protein